MESFKVDITDWAKFNPRSDRGNFNWFRMQKDLFFNLCIKKGLDGKSVLLFVFLLCESCACNGATVSVRYEYVSSITGLSKTEIQACLLALTRLNQIALNGVEQGSSALEAALKRSSSMNGTERNGTDKTNETKNCSTSSSDSASNLETKPAPRGVSKSDLDEIYDQYPRKKGKHRGLDRLRIQIKTTVDLGDLRKALNAFKANLVAEGTEAKFIPYFSSWVGSWRDWLDPDAGKSTINTCATNVTPLSDNEIFGQVLGE